VQGSFLKKITSAKYCAFLVAGYVFLVQGSFSSGSSGAGFFPLVPLVQGSFWKKKIIRT
jgi:hypothetical protein